MKRIHIPRTSSHGKKEKAIMHDNKRKRGNEEEEKDMKHIEEWILTASYAKLAHASKMIKQREMVLNMQQKAQMTIGQSIRFFQDKKTETFQNGFIYGVIIKKNQKSISVKTLTERQWNISPVLVEKDENVHDFQQDKALYEQEYNKLYL